MLKSVYGIKKMLTKIFPYNIIIISRHKFCDYCQLAVQSDLFCHGKENVHEFVTADLEAQLLERFKGNYSNYFCCMYRHCSQAHSHLLHSEKQEGLVLEVT